MHEYNVNVYSGNTVYHFCLAVICFIHVKRTVSPLILHFSIDMFHTCAPYNMNVYCFGSTVLVSYMCNLQYERLTLNTSVIRVQCII